jgi:phosphohistidine phosphatase SixA
MPGPGDIRTAACRDRHGGILPLGMQLFLVRHAEAAPGEPDELRPLTPVGREQARALGARLRQHEERPEVVLTSPLVRAQETGRLIAEETGAELRVASELAPGATAERVARALRSVAASAIVAVCHQPDCSRIAAALTGEPEPAFPPAGSIAIQLGE